LASSLNRRRPAGSPLTFTDEIAAEDGDRKKSWRGTLVLTLVLVDRI
jgi:hypothetical protein